MNVEREKELSLLENGVTWLSQGSEPARRGTGSQTSALRCAAALVGLAGEVEGT